MRGLIPAMQEVMPGVAHRYCAMHLWRNFTKQWRDKELKNVVWECARSRTIPQFNEAMEKVKTKNVAAFNYLNKWPKEAWTKAYFGEGVKCDNICNNACEAFNAKILKYRGKPILTFLEEIRCHIMRTLANNSMKLRFSEQVLPPMQKSKLEKLKRESNFWTPTWTGDSDGCRYEVKCNNMQLDVNLSAHTCSCRAWQLTGMPCKHAIAAIAFKCEEAENYCHAWLTMSAYRSTYEFFVKPMQSQEFWEKTDYIQPQAPKVAKRKAGRPKKNRRKDGNEEPVAGSKLKRAYPPITCTRCGLENHNIRTCQNQGVPIRPRNFSQSEGTETETENENGLQNEIDNSQNAPSNVIDSSQQSQTETQVIL